MKYINTKAEIKRLSKRLKNIVPESYYEYVGMVLDNARLLGRLEITQENLKQMGGDKNVRVKRKGQKRNERSHR